MKPTDIPKDTECKFSSGASNYGLEREEKKSFRVAASWLMVVAVVLAGIAPLEDEKDRLLGLIVKQFIAFYFICANSAKRIGGQIQEPVMS